MKTSLRAALALLIVLVPLFAFSSPAQTKKPKGPQASVNGDRGNGCSEGRKCRDFVVAFQGPMIRPKTTGEICWLGSCRKAETDKRAPNWIYAKPKFNNVGPYRCGTPTTVTLKYKGRTYVDKTRITCFAA